MTKNTKSEARNPKQIPTMQTTNSKRQSLLSVKAHGVAVWNFLLWSFGIRFGFRVSDFGFLDVPIANTVLKRLVCE